MLIDFRAIVQSKYGAPEKVLSIAKRQFNSEEAGAARPTGNSSLQSYGR